MSTRWNVTLSQSDVLVRLATLEDIPALVAMSDEVDAWQKARGIPSGGAPPRPLPQIFSERVTEGVIYIARLEGEPAATITIYAELEALWADLPGEALYVHGLLVGRRFAGRGVGVALLGWAEDRARERNLPLLRLDCDGNNPRLRAYYEDAGFAHCGNVRLPHRLAARYERVVRGTGQ